MNIEQKLEFFSKATILEAKEIRDNMLKAFKRKLNEDYEAMAQIEEQKAHENIKSLTHALEQKLNKELIEHTNTMRKSLAQERIALIETIFENVLLKINEFRYTQKYNDYICDQIAEIINQYGSDIKIYLSQEDLFLIDNIRVKTGMDTYIDEKSFIGGVRAVVKDGKISVDKTLLSRLSAERELFNHLKFVE